MVRKMHRAITGLEVSDALEVRKGVAVGVVAVLGLACLMMGWVVWAVWEFRWGGGGATEGM